MGRCVRRWRSACAAILAMAICACSPNGSAGQPSTQTAPLVQRATLLGRSVEHSTERLADLVPSEEWTVLSGESNLRGSKRFGPGPFLRIHGDDGLRVRVPVPAEAQAFNRIEIDLLIRSSRAAVALESFAGTNAIYRVLQPARGQNRIQRVALQVPYWARKRTPPEALELEFLHTRRAMIARIELVREDWGRRLPSAQPAPIEIGGRTHPALGLQTGNALLTEVDVPAQATLHVVAGIPRELATTRQRSLELRVTIGEGNSRVETLALDSTGPETWKERTVDLSAYAGQRIGLRYELVAEGDDAAFAAVAEPLVRGRQAEPRTIVLITSDTHRSDHLAAAGVGPDVSTPALDRLASEGVLYETCFASTNVTIPSHVALMTGTHVRDTGVSDNFSSLADAAPTLAEHFRDAGFVTLAVVSSAHLDHARSGLGQGFDRMNSPQARCRAEETFGIANQALQALEGSSVFLWLHLFDAHTPYAPPEGFTDPYYPAGKDPYDPALPELLPGQHLPLDEELRDLDYARALYRGEVSYLDTELGAFLDQPRLRDATVLFTADHGESLGEHEIYWDHAGVYPESTQVPMLLRGPKVPRGRRVPAPVRQIDAGRTLLDLAGLAEVEFPGRSLLEALQEDDGQRYVARTPQFVIGAHGLEAAIHDGPWFLVLVLQTYRVNPRYERTRHMVELFDLTRDPGCKTNLVADERSTAAELRKKLIAWLDAVQPMGWDVDVADDDETLQRMAELGYTDLETDTAGTGSWFDTSCRCDACAVWEDPR